MYKDEAGTSKPKQLNGPARDLVPVQSTFEFAELSLANMRRLNSQLENLRTRLFGDGAEMSDPAPPEPAQRPLQNTLAGLHWEIGRAEEQLDAIHKRL